MKPEDVKLADEDTHDQAIPGEHYRVTATLALKDTATPDELAALLAQARRMHAIGSEADITRALEQVPPGRSLANEYVRQRDQIRELQRQTQRAVELRLAADQRAGKRNVAKLEEQIRSLETVQSYLVLIAEAAPWLSCAHLQQALQAELPDYYDAGGQLSALRGLFDVNLEQKRSPEELADLKTRGLLP